MSDGVPRRSPASVPLLGGRGPGVGHRSGRAHQRADALRRSTGRPVVEQLAQLHERTAAACGDADAMRRDLTRTRNQFAVDVDRLAGRLGPSRGRAALPRLVVAVGALVLVAAARRRRRDAADR